MKSGVVDIHSIVPKETLELMQTDQETRNINSSSSKYDDVYCIYAVCSLNVEDKDYMDRFVPYTIFRRRKEITD